MLSSLSDLMSGFPDIPLSTASKAYQKEILSIPYTEEPMHDEQPEGIDPDEVDRLHDLALNAPKRAVKPIQDCIKRFPNYPTLRNYLIVAYDGMGRKRQAKEVRKQLLKDHPDYWFGRYGLAMDELAAGNIDKAEEAIGGELDIRTAYPERNLFHVSEMRTFYLVVGIIHARRGESELARGVHAALMVLDPRKEAAEMLLREILMANLANMQKRTKNDEAKRITVRQQKLAKRSATSGPPDFQHVSIACLYESGLDLPEETIREILSLPRESLVEDLLKVMNDCVDRTPEFMQLEQNPRNTFALFHALHLLAEVKGIESLPSLLQVLSLHPDAFDFWLGETSAYCEQIFRLVGDGIPDCVAWLKLPGIDARHKGILCEGLETLARHDADRREEVVAGMKEVLAFLLGSPREDNVLDTHFIALLISCLIEVRAESAMPLIEQAYDMNFVEEGFVGTLESVKTDISEPLRPPEKLRSIEAEYRYWQNDGRTDPSDEEYEPDNLVRPGFGDSSWSRFGDEPESTPEPGRNDPCPCGSGKKYKKCCLR